MQQIACCYTKNSQPCLQAKNLNHLVPHFRLSPGDSATDFGPMGDIFAPSVEECATRNYETLKERAWKRANGVPDSGIG
jgi:hypothetical protein